MNSWTKGALLGAGLAAMMGLTLAGQVVPVAWANSGISIEQYAQESGYFSVPSEYRQSAVAFGLAREIRDSLGQERVNELEMVESTSELVLYLEQVVSECAECPIAEEMLLGANVGQPGIPGKHYGGAILDAAESFQVAALCGGGGGSTPPPPDNPLECLYNWGVHIGPVDSECGGMPERFCPDEPEPGDGDPPSDEPETEPELF